MAHLDACENVHSFSLPPMDHGSRPRTSSKDLEPNKWVKVEGWVDGNAAKAEILAGVERYKNAKEKPYF